MDAELRELGVRESNQLCRGCGGDLHNRYARRGGLCRNNYERPSCASRFTHWSTFVRSPPASPMRGTPERMVLVDEWIAAGCP